MTTPTPSPRSQTENLSFIDSQVLLNLNSEALTRAQFCCWVRAGSMESSSMDQALGPPPAISK